MIAKKFKYVNNNLMFIIKLLLTYFIKKKTRHYNRKAYWYERYYLAIFGGVHKRQAGQVWPHLPFLTGRGPSKMLVGGPPQTRLFGTKCPKEVGCVTAAIASVPYRPAPPSVRADGRCWP